MKITCAVFGNSLSYIETKPFVRTQVQGVKKKGSYSPKKDKEYMTKAKNKE